MIQIREKKNSENWVDLRKSFYDSLTSPFDGMWDELVHDHGQLWGFYDEDQLIGYCSKDNEGQLINFFLSENYSDQKVELFQRILFLLEIRYAIVSTNNPDFLVVSLEKSKKMKVHSYLFENTKDVDESGVDQILNTYEFQPALNDDFENLVLFCEKNIEANTGWLKTYLKRLIDRNEVHLLKNNDQIIASCEIRKSDTQPKIIDLGVIVDTSHRKKGIGSALMATGRKMSLAQNFSPICSCEQQNIGSKKMIENAGFTSTNMILKITF